MTDFTLYSPENAPQGSKDLLNDLENNFGFLPNIFGYLAESPVALEFYPKLDEIFQKTSFSLEEKQIVLLAASVENECNFCVTAHSTALRQKLQADGEVIDAAREGRDLPDEKLNALYQFVQTVVQKRGHLDSSDIDKFLAAGYSKENVLEVLIGVAMKTFTNYANHLFETEINEELKEEAWSPDKKKAA